MDNFCLGESQNNLYSERKCVDLKVLSLRGMCLGRVKIKGKVNIKRLGLRLKARSRSRVRLKFEV